MRRNTDSVPRGSTVPTAAGKSKPAPTRTPIAPVIQMDAAGARGAPQADQPAGERGQREVQQDGEIFFLHISIILKTALAADERRFTQMHHAVYAPKPFTLLAGWRIQAAY